MKSKILKPILIIEILLYITFLYIDIFIPAEYRISILLKYISIVLCFFITILSYKNNSHDLRLLRAGIFITILADLFLLILNKPTLGVGLFSIVQIIYAIRYNHPNNNKTIKYLIILLVLILSPYLTIPTLRNTGLILPLASFYFICILSNTIKSIKLAIINNTLRYHLIATAMVLFILCDINVGICNATLIINLNIPNQLFVISSIGMWLFYLPSQILLSLSAIQPTTHYQTNETIQFNIENNK